MSRTTSSPLESVAFAGLRRISARVALALSCALGACNAEPDKGAAGEADTSSISAGGQLDGAVPAARDAGPAPLDAGAALRDGSSAASANDAEQPRDGGTPDGGAEAGSALAPADGYTIAMCPGRTPNELPAQRPACDGETRCAAAHCVSTERLSEEQLARTPDCSAGKCVPDQLARAGAFRFQPCTGELGEGRCIPRCFAIWTNPLAAVFALGEFGCGKEEVCAPCLDPIDQTPTGLCTGDPCTAAD